MNEMHLVIAIFILAGIWQFFRVPPLFEIRIVAGQVAIRLGKVRGSFLHDLQEVIRNEQVQFGVIKGIRQGQQTRLNFSPGFSPACRQLIRNIWQASSVC